MKTKKRFFIGLLCSMMITAFSFAVVSCFKEVETTDYGESGSYYVDVNGKEYLISLNDNKFTLTLDGETQSGDYAYDGNALSLTFAGEETATQATLKDGVLTVTIDGSTYNFLKKVNYSVTYDVNGGSALPATSTLNGKTLSKPEDPTKEGYNFIAWYIDSEYTTPFAFDSQPITSDITLYARFESVVVGQSEFTATYIVDGEVYNAQQTIGGVLYNLPVLDEKDGNDFAGWWMSDYQDAEKLTAKYDGEQLAESVKLFAVWEGNAPLISVSETGASWNASGVNNSYTVKITAPDGTIETKTVGTAKYEYDFASKAAGTYKVEVSLNGKNAVAYYNNKALDRVSLFSVAEPAVLVFNNVANAENYYVTVDCGNKNHKHTLFNNGTSTNFSFTNCDMQEGGIKFTVTATATGYAQSVSDVFVYSRDLAAIKGVVIDEETDTIVWDKVTNATSYVVEVTAGGKTYTQNVGTANTYSLKEYTGEIKVAVSPVAQGYNSPEATTLTYNKTRLGTPTNVRVENETIAWDEVEGAIKYNVKIGAQVYAVTDGTQFVLTDAHYVDGQEEYQISVQAIGATEDKNSVYSDVTNVKYQVMSAVAYENGVVSWEHVIGATSYGIKVNNGNEQKVAVGENNFQVVLTQAGTNTVSVRYYDANEIPSSWSNVSVFAFTVTFDVRGGEAIAPMYKAVGDTVELPETTYAGYDLNGWYNIPGGAANNGLLYTDGSFVVKGDMWLYAYWGPKAYDVELRIVDRTTGEYKSDFVQLYYRENFNIAPAVAGVDYDLTQVFTGWYTDQNAQGFRYTDSQGKSTQIWDIIPPEGENAVLYAGLVDAFIYKLSKNTYSIKKNDSVASYLERVQVPAEYKGKPVATIEAEAFVDCKNLVSISIPDTITKVTFGVDGGNGSGSAFYGCDNLRTVEIYKAKEGNYEVKYSSVDGVLFYNNDNNGIELRYLPSAITGTYEIPSKLPVPMYDSDTKPIDTVTTIPTGGLAKTSISELIIPSTITKIDSSAFSGCENLTSVVFKPAADGVEEKPLTVGNKIFNGCTKLTEITFPARIDMTDEETGKFNEALFTGCSNLANINITGTGGLYSSADGALYNTDGTELIYCPLGKSSYTLPLTAQKIGENAFAGNTKLAQIVIPAHITDIGEQAFKGCTNLSKITFEGESTDTALFIEGSAFYGCTKLKEVTLPANLGKLSKNAFGNCTNLKIVNLESDERAVYEDGAFESIPSSTSTTKGSYYVTTVNVGKNVPVIAFNAIFGTSTLSTVNIEKNDNYHTSEDGVVFSADETKLVFYPTNKFGSYKIPDKVVEIYDGVFSYKNITAVTIGKNVEKIGDDAFYYCRQLKTITFEDGDKPLTIGDRAFYYNISVEKFELPTRLRKIGNNAFYYCYNITELEIPEGVEEIGNQAFRSCGYLRKVTLPSTLERLGEYDENGKLIAMQVFQTCDEIEQFIVSDKSEHFMTDDKGILYVKKDGLATELLTSPRGVTGDIVIPASVTKVWDRAFEYCRLITNITFEEPAEGEEYLPYEIGSYFVQYCDSLETITLRSGIKEIPSYAFYYSRNVKTINVPNTVASIGDHAFYYCDKLETIDFEEGHDENKTPLVFATYKSGSYYYGYNIYQCKSLKSLTLPARTTSFGRYAVAYCSSLEEVNVPKDLESADSYAYYYLAKLKTFTFDEGCRLSELPQYFFYYCALKTEEGVDIQIPNSIIELGKYTFYSSKIKSMSISKNIKALPDYFLYNCRDLETVTFAPDSKLEKIGSYAFSTSYNSNLQNVVLPASLTTIGDYAFSNNKKLNSITFESGSRIAKIGERAFQNTVLTEFTFPKVTTVDADGKELVNTIAVSQKIFFNCSELKTVTLSESVVDVGGVFAGCRAIQSIVIPENHPNFAVLEDNQEYKDKMVITNPAGNSIEYVQKDLKAENGEYRIPSTIWSIAANAFEGQTSIKKLIIPATVKEIGPYAFANCVSIEEIVFESGSPITTIPASAFRNCGSLKKVTLPKGLTTIDEYAFYCCTSLTEFVVPEGVSTIGYYAFAYCYELEKVTLPSTWKVENPEDNKKAKNSAYLFSYCTSLESVTLPEGIEALPYYMFNHAGGENFKNLELPSTLTAIGSYAFAYSTVQSVSLPESVETFGKYIFSNSTVKYVSFEGKLTSLPDYMFYYTKELETVKLPEGITYLGNYTFYYSGLKSIEIPDSVTVIGTSATDCADTATRYMFYQCTRLTSVKLPKNLERMAGYVFYHCDSLKEIEIPETLTFMGNYCFAYSGLESIDLSNVTDFGGGTTLASGGYVFYNCKNLKSVILNDNLSMLRGNMFNGCTSLDTVQTVSNDVINGERGVVTLPSKLSYLGNKCFASTAVEKFVNTSTKLELGTEVFGNCTELTEVNFKNQLTAIPESMFSGCTKLANFEIPDTVTYVGPSAFKGTALSSVKISANIESIGTNAFAQIPTLAEFIVDANNENYSVGEYGALYDKTGGVMYYYPVASTNEKVVLKDGIEYDQYAFYGAKNIKEVTLPEGITKIGAYQLAYFESLENFTIPDTVTTIEEYAFSQTSLKKITIPASVTTIGDYAFAYTDITEITFPETVTTWGKNMFAYCNELEKINIPSTWDTIPDYFYGYSGVTNVVIPAHIKKIGAYAFQYTGNLASVTYEEGSQLEEVGKYAFYYAGFASSAEYQNVENMLDGEGYTVQLPASVRVVGDSESTTGYTFAYSAVEEVLFERDSELEKLSAYTFSYCKFLKNVVLPKYIGELGYITTSASSSTQYGSVFYNCYKLETVTLPESCGGVFGSSMFSNCYKLKSVIIPEGVTDLPGSIFNNCYELASVTFPSTLETISGSSVFNGCSSLKSVELPETLVSITGTSIFLNCTSLENVTLPSGLESIPNYTFEGCTSLNNLFIPKGVTFIGSYAFRGLTSEQTIYIEDSLFNVASIWNVAWNHSSKANFVFESQNPAQA